MSDEPELEHCIRLKAVYAYALEDGTGRRSRTGHFYVPLAFFTDLPSQQTKLLVRAKSGPEKNQLFGITLAGFTSRYHLIEDTQQLPEKATTDERAEA